MKVIITVWYSVKPGMREQCIELARKNVEETRKEEGNLSYAHYPSIENEQDMFVMEVWESMEAVKKHISAPHYLAFSQARKPMLVEGSYRYVIYSGKEVEAGDGISTWSDNVTVQRADNA